jgi:acetate kinase
LRVISLQLGAGASVAAVLDGRALDVSMGYSTLEGLVMGTRCGDVDPGAILALLADADGDASQLRNVLAHQSGLLGLSGRTPHVGELLAHQEDADCRLALDVYCHRIRHYIGAYMAQLGGADALIFGGGAGENQPELRRRLLDRFEWAGFRIDADRNATLRGPGFIGDPLAGPAQRVLVGHVDEAYEMATIVAARFIEGAGAAR